MAFRDGEGVNRDVEVAEAVFRAFDEFELDDLSRLNELDNHLDSSGVDVDKLSPNSTESIEERVLENSYVEHILDAVKTLTGKQRRRLKLHFIDGLTYMQIASAEGCSHTAVRKTINNSLQKIQTILKK